jgi:peptidyl-prolyl cis-trans isomerase C
MARLTFISRVLIAALALPAFVVAQEGDFRAVAVVGGRPILASDLRDRVAAERRQAAMENRLEAFGSKAVATTLAQMVDVKLFAAQARAEGLADRADVKRAIEAAIDGVLAATLVGERAHTVALDEPTLRRYYDEHPQEFERGASVRARHIVVKTELEANAIFDKLQKGADFVQLARANNIDATRDRGGDLGVVQRGVMVEAFDRAVFALKPGDISPVVRTAYGFHIARVDAIEPAARAPFATVVADIRQKVLQTQVQVWKAEIARSHTVTIDQQVLKSIQ